MGEAPAPGFVWSRLYTREGIGAVVGGDVQQRGLPWKGKRATCAIPEEGLTVAPRMWSWSARPGRSTSAARARARTRATNSLLRR